MPARVPFSLSHTPSSSFFLLLPRRIPICFPPSSFSPFFQSGSEFEVDFLSEDFSEKRKDGAKKNGSRKLETYRGSHQTPPNLFGTAKNRVVLIANCFATFRRGGKNGEFVLCTGIGAPSFARRLSSRQLGKVSHFEGRRRRLPHHTKAETQRRGVLPSREKHCGSFCRLRCQNYIYRTRKSHPRPISLKYLKSSKPIYQNRTFWQSHCRKSLGNCEDFQSHSHVR